MSAAGAATSSAATSGAASLRWLDIVRLGIVQAALGSVVVLVISSLNRVMVVEYALPSVLPGALVALHYGVQMLRPRFGYGSDKGGRRTPWIVGGMAMLALGGVLCAVATIWIARAPVYALTLAAVAYSMVGLGAGAAGTSLLVLLAKRVDDRRRAAAATLMWVLMIAGFAVTSTVVGHFLDPFSAQRLVLITALAASAAFVIAGLAVWRVEGPAEVHAAPGAGGQRAPGAGGQRVPGAHPVPGAQRDVSFKAVLRRVWSEPEVRGFTIFVFVSMLAYSAQELLLEPFAGLVFHYSLGESTQLSGLWHAAVLIGMFGVGIGCRRLGALRTDSLRAWTIGGCVASGTALLSLACADLVGSGWPLRASVVALGFANGVFAVSAIGSMMELAHRGAAGSAGTRMGLWGASQAVAFALGGIAGTSIVDAIRYLFGSPIAAFAMVFCIEAILFFTAAGAAASIGSTTARRASAATAVPL